MSVGLRFVLPYQTVIDDIGVPIPGALLYFYVSGTSTPLDTYSDAGLTVPNSNPVQANSAGVFPNIFLTPNPYKVVLTDSGFNQIWTADPVSWTGIAGQVVRTVTASGPVNQLVGDEIIIIDKSANEDTNVNLLIAALMVMPYLVVKDGRGNASTYRIRLTPDGGETIDGQSFIDISSDYGSFKIIAITGGWLTIS